jgi:hypothetical protein
LKIDCIEKEIITSLKRPATEWKKIFASSPSDRGLVAEYISNSKHLTINKQVIQLKMGQ